MSQGRTIYEVQVNEDARTRYGAPRQAFAGKPEQLDPEAGFDVLPYGSGFVMVQRLPLEDAAVVYVRNWISGFERRP